MVASSQFAVEVHAVEFGGPGEAQLDLFGEFPLEPFNGRFAAIQAAAGKIPTRYVGVPDEKNLAVAVFHDGAHADGEGLRMQHQAFANAMRQGDTGQDQGIQSCHVIPAVLFASSMLRLAHLSDIHLGPLPPVVWHALMSKRITGYVNWQRNRRQTLQPEYLIGILAHIKAQAPDHVAITGDLVNLGMDAEFDAVRKWLDLLGDPRDVTVICGNHDAYVPGALQRALRAWEPFVTGDDRAEIRGDRDYPVLRRRGRVSIIGCNSAHASLPFMAVGRFGRSQARRLARMLAVEGKEGRFRVVAIHHPPFSGATAPHKRLNGAARFRDVVAEAGAELVLHGHTHLESFVTIRGPDGPVPVIGVPSAGQAPGGNAPAGRYNLFSIEGEPDRWKVGWSEYGYGAPGTDVVQLGERILQI
jgi:3',5'-cyclic AMP phosphodiesterase CpdA